MSKTPFVGRPAALLFALALVSGCAAPRPVEPERPAFVVEAPPSFRTEGVRIATFNTEFLFDGEGDEGQADFAWKGDPAAARAHRDAVAAVIRTLDADVLVLEEVETRRVLELLIEESLADMGYTPYFVQGDDRFTGQDVAILARVPVEEVGRTDERAPVGLTDETYGVSKNIWARLDLAGIPTTVVGVHFLAQPDNPERKPRREAQAEVIRRLVAAESAAGRAVVVMGDFNDFDDVALDARASVPITDVLARIKRGGDTPDDDLRNAIAEVPQEERFTNFYDRDDDAAFDVGEFSTLDHVLLSPRLYERVREVHYVHAHDPREVTDHFPIVVTLER